MPPHREIADALASADVFCDVARESVERLARGATYQQVQTGDVIVRLGEESDAMYLVCEGTFAVYVDDEHGPQLVGAIAPGQLIGEVQLVTGGRRTATVTARGPGMLVRLDKEVFDREAAEHPDILTPVVAVITRRLLGQQLARALLQALGLTDLALLQQLEDSAEWVHLDRGGFLFLEGEVGDAAYLLVSGELSVVTRRHEDDELQLLGEITTGELVGEIALLSESVRTATVVARRSSWLLRFDRDNFTRLVLQRPESLTSLVNVLVKRIRWRREDQPADNCDTIAFLPLSPRVAVRDLAEQVGRVMRSWGPIEIMTAPDARRSGLLRDPRSLALEHPAWLRLTLWVRARRRDKVRVLLIGDPENTTWNQRIIAEADHLVLVADPREAPDITEVENALPWPRLGVPWEPSVWMVLAHQADVRQPHGTAAWLDGRDIDQHLHVRHHHDGDLARLARFLCGRARGLAMSGGAARGTAHIGVYYGLMDAGVAIDYLAGTSAGAIVAGILGYDRTFAELMPELLRILGPTRNPFGDFTLPLTALSHGQRMRKMVIDLVGEIQVEDLWLPASIVCTNLTQGTRAVFERGLIWRVIQASGSPPGIAVPVVIDGEVYCDGGVVENLPVSVLLERRCQYRFASNVGTSKPIHMGGEVEFPSPWAMLWDKFVKEGASYSEIPRIMEILLRVTTLASNDRLSDVLRHADLYFEPPVSSFDWLDFSKPKPLVQAGYEHAREVLDRWERLAEFVDHD